MTPELQIQWPKRMMTLQAETCSAMFQLRQKEEVSFGYAVCEEMKFQIEMFSKQLEIKLREDQSWRSMTSSTKKCHEDSRMDRLLKGYHAEEKETRTLILQQFLLWFETKKNQKWLVIPVKAASYSNHPNN